MPKHNKITIRTAAGKRTYPNMKAAAAAAGINYLTLYMRVRAGMAPSAAFKAPVRKYQARASA